ncbi:hypothetical protein BGV47_16345 [Burkholderia ubonensis]|uniref:hypothetical protein n=1 Tax=Burkholderia ubonensis TaxID=101571 RepID=UPI0008FE16E7|nr:hypothetical protein [Burkholderia ubonensis]OJA37903.1 hypothetical protein BGV47_16345 [Burkholderia ubonensis]OJB29505.1 hypothetical protein BGV55_15495 [Burkholderia ubonensis]
MFGTKIVKGGCIVGTSKNLRGMRDYARKSPVACVETRRSPANRHNGQLTVTYADGAYCTVHFASYGVMIDWVRARRSWRQARHVMRDEDMGYLTRPGLIAS